MRLPDPRPLRRPALSATGWTRRRWLAAMGLIAAASPLPAAGAGLPAAVAPPDQDIAVRVQKAGSEVVVDINCPVRAPIPVVWDVLTDYDHMATFISTLKLSVVERRVDNLLTVRQTGKVSHGPFSYAFDTVREVELVPVSEIRSRLISGDLKASAFTTRIVDLEGLVHISNSGRYTPTMWVPPVVGPALIEGEMRKQYAEIRAEILRRSARQAASLMLTDHGNDLRI